VTVDGETSDPRRVLRTGETVPSKAGIARKEFRDEIIRASRALRDEEFAGSDKPAGCTVVRNDMQSLPVFQAACWRCAKARARLRQSWTYSRGGCATTNYRPAPVHRSTAIHCGGDLRQIARRRIALTQQFKTGPSQRSTWSVVHGEMPTPPGSSSGRRVAEHQLDA